MGKISIEWGNRKKSTEYTPTPQGDEAVTPAQSPLSVTISNALSIFNNPQAAIIWAYGSIAEITAPVNWARDAASSVPIVHKRLVKGKYEVVENSPFTALLNKPNQFENGKNYKDSFYLNLILTGETFVNPFKPIGFGVDKLYIFPSNTVAIDYLYPCSTDFRNNKVVKYRVNNGITTILPEDMVYRKQVNKLQNPTERGVSVLMALANTAKSLQAGAEASIVTKESRGATGLLAPPENSVFNADDQKVAEDALYARAGITGGKRPVVMVSKPLNFTSMAMNVREMGLAESRLTDLRNVCSILKISSQLVSDVQGSTYNNLKIIEKSLYNDCAVPLIDYYCAFHEEVFEMDGYNDILEGDYSDIDALQADRKINNDILNQQYQAGVIRGDEWRVADGKDEQGLGYKTDNNGQGENQSGQGSQQEENQVDE